MSSRNKFILAIDLGTSGPKVALFSTQGELVGSEFEETPLVLLPDGGAEQSPGAWWEAIQRATKRLLARGIVPNDEIVVIAFTGQWSGTVAVDEEGVALSNAIIWMDSRGAPYIQQIVHSALKVQGYGLGKLWRWVQRTGGVPATAGKDPIAHILYLKHVHPDIYQNTYKFLEPMDYLGYRLTGHIATSFDSITLHWLTDNRDIRNIKYDDELIRLSTIDRLKLPDIKPSNSILGLLRPEIAREWGLGESVQVVIGSPDIHSSAIGSGAVGDYETHLYIGTSSWLTCHVPFKKTDLLHNLAALPSAIPGRYLLTDEQECAGVCLQFLRDNILFHQDELTTGEKPGNVYQLFDVMASRVAAGSAKVIFTPWLYGERAPVDDRFVRGGFFNQSLQTTREHMVRAVFEGVAYNSRWLLKYVEQFIKRRVEAINMVGGGAKSSIWCQIHADVLNRTIRQVKDPVEVNVRGAALLAASALGYIRYEDIASFVPIQESYIPNPDHRKIYDELFQDFMAIYERNRRIYEHLNRTQG
ncbi:MAG TPA: FGGY-family carbohydrate kinase [Anaerolineales bacterium]|nr:FGGY-family carbohydrate kinase [Anaerolineales bacterium]HLO32275.1 FGGY-family carbohydrate kinase [Anaerolineales bacterium]